MICDTTFSVRTSRALRQQFRARYGTISFFSLDAIYNCPQCVFVFTFDAASSAMFLFIFYKINDRSDFPIGNLRIMGEFFIKHPVPNFRVVKITYFYQHMLLVFASRKMKFSCLFYHMSGINSSTFFQIYRSCSAPTHRHTNDRAVMRQNKAKNARDKTISVCAALSAVCFLPASSKIFHTQNGRHFPMPPVFSFKDIRLFSRLLDIGKEPCVKGSAQGGRCAARPLRGRSRFPAF